MNKLGLKISFNRYFLDETSTTYLVRGELRPMRQSDVLSLDEFFELNSISGRSVKSLITRKPEFKPKKNALSVNTTSFYNLKDLLEKKGFNCEDWIWLADKKLRIEELPKEKILELPITEVFGIYSNCLPMKNIGDFFFAPAEMILVKDLMIIDDETISNSSLLLAVPTLQITQRRLRRYGFNDSDGPFMRASLDFFTRKNKRLF